MLRLPRKRLDAQTQQALALWQADIDSQSGFDAQAARAQQLYSSTRVSSSLAIQTVRTKLAEMSSGAQRCHYCEDSAGYQIEHIEPKALYPGKTFRWTNFLYACGHCNQSKLDHFCILTPRRRILQITATRNQLGIRQPPPRGKSLFINPRLQNPLDYIQLDLRTFEFAPIQASGIDFERGNRTISILGLNSREYLKKARQEAYENYCCRLEVYIQKRNAHEPAKKLLLLKKRLQKVSHPTVWAEMKRVYQQFGAQCRRQFPDIYRLFSQAPEALTW